MLGRAEVDCDVRPASDGSLALVAELAAIFAPTPGEPRCVQAPGEPEHIGFWTNPRAKAVWLARVERPGKYQVLVEQACEAGVAGSEYQLCLGDAVLQGSVEPTPSWRQYAAVHQGSVQLTAGTVRVVLSPLNLRRGAFMNVRGVRLVPA